MICLFLWIVAEAIEFKTSSPRPAPKFRIETEKEKRAQSYCFCSQEQTPPFEGSPSFAESNVKV